MDQVGAEKIRAFLALPLSEHFQESVSVLLHRLGYHATHIKWVNPEALHLTLHFFGNIERTEIADICGALRDPIVGIKGFDIGLDRIGYFPHAEKPRVVWLGLRGEVDVLAELHARVRQTLTGLGYATEDRPFVPHVTIGRRRRGTGSGKIPQIDLEPTELARISACVLYRSHLSSKGPRYEKIETFPLG